SGVPQNELSEHHRTVLYKVGKMGQQFGDCIIIKYFPRHKAGVHTLEAHLQQLSAEGFKADFIVVDFLNYLMPAYSNNIGDHRYYELQAVASEWIAMCQKNQVVGWSGMQAHRGARG